MNNETAKAIPELAHAIDCVEAIDAIGGDPATVAELVAALRRSEHKLAAYVGVCSGDKELTGAVLPMIRAVLAKIPEAP